MSRNWLLMLALGLSLLLVAAAVAAADPMDEARALDQKAFKLYQAGRYQEALPLLQRSLKISEKVLGPEHPNTANILTGLADLYKQIGAYDQALPLYQRALKIWEKALGPEHRTIATYLSNLAWLYAEMGAYDQALPLYLQSLKIAERALGPDHPDIAITLNNLAVLYQAMGDYDKALTLYQRALGIRLNTLGQKHLDTTNSLNTLAGLYKTMGEYDQALPLYQRALKIREKALGPEHPSVATILNNLAELYQTMGDYDQALPLYQRALKIWEKALGPEHPTTATSLHNLASLYEAMGDYDKALPLYQQALKIKEKILGPEHPDTAASYSNLGNLYLSRKDYQDAEAYFRRGKSKVGLTDLFLVQGKPEEALELIQAPTWRDPPPYHVQYNTQIGLALAGMGRFREAALVLRQAVQGVEDRRRRTPGERAGYFQGGNIRPYRGLVSALGEMALKPEALPPALQVYGPDAGAAAFYFAEATKGRVLLETLVAAARQETRIEIPAELRQKEESLLNQQAALESQWEKALKGGEAAVKEAQEKKTRLSGELRVLIQELRHNYPLYAALHYPLPVPAAELPLKENEVLLEYALGEAAGYVMVARKGGVTKVVKIALGREELEADVKAFMEPFLDRQPDGFSLSRGKKLSDLLLAGVLPEVKADERIIIVPDGILALLPFDALVLQEGKGLQDSVFVGDRYSLSYYQSAAILALKRRLQEERAGRPLFALGNPVFSKQDPRYVSGPPGEKSPAPKARGGNRPRSGPWPQEGTLGKLRGTAKPGKSSCTLLSRKPRARSWLWPSFLASSPSLLTSSWTLRPTRPFSKNPPLRSIATSTSPPTPISPARSRASKSPSFSWARWGTTRGTTAFSP